MHPALLEGMKLRWLMPSLAVGWGVALGCSDDEPTEPVGGGGGVASCEAEPLECDDCPTFDELRDDCATMYRVSCDRLLVEPRSVSPSNRYEYCFDAEGVLVGRVESVDVPSKRTVTGVDCGPRSDDLEPVCVGGAGGGGGAAGAGGPP